MKLRIKKICFLHMILLLCFNVIACTSSPVVVKYYLLNARADLPKDEAINQTFNKSLLIESVKLAGFLRQSGLVLQYEKNQLHMSNTHLWAENLSEAIPKVLQSKLQHQSAGYNVYLNAENDIEKVDFSLRVRIDSLHPSDEGEVIAAGKYQVVSEGNQEAPMAKDFYFMRELSQDGHSHAVEQIDTLLGLIAADVLATIDAEANRVE